MYDAMSIVQVDEAFQDRLCDLANNVNVDSTMLSVYPIQRSAMRQLNSVNSRSPPVHALHADTNVRVRQKRAIERDNVRT